MSRHAPRQSRRSVTTAQTWPLIGSTIDGSSFSGLLTRVEIGHMRIGSAETVASIREDQARRSPADIISGSEDHRIRSWMSATNSLTSVVDNREGADPFA